VSDFTKTLVSAIQTRVQSVERTIDVLNALAEGASSLTEVARAAGLSKGTTFRLLATLSYGGIALKDPLSNRYLLGPGLMRLVRGATRPYDAVVAISLPELTSLWEMSSETVTLHARLGLDRICIQELPSPHALRYTASVGASAPIYVGSAGKLLLAFENPARLKVILAGISMRPLTDHTITDRTCLEFELERIRREGYASSEGERVVGAAAISVPVVGPDELILALSILGPSQRMTSARQSELLKPMLKVAAAISRVLDSLQTVHVP
jgi:IclR family acetate operon transcriptional repressor